MKGYQVLREDGIYSFIKKSLKYCGDNLYNLVDRTALRPSKRFFFHRKYAKGIDIMARDWDYLIFLDACRYDIFRQYVNLDGELESVISKGSHSREFCKAHFDGQEYFDTVYVTANGYGAQIGESTFHDLIFTDEMDSVPDADVLHSTRSGLAPSTVYNAAVEAYEDYPDKRIIIHFMQPHMPYFGSKADALRRRVEKEGLTIRSRKKEKIDNSQRKENVESGLDGAFRKGYITAKELRKVYIENLQTVIPYIRRLLGELDGKIVVTSDHGEYLGEYGKAGHYEYEYSEELRMVPWLTVSSDSRPDITNEEPTDVSTIGEGTVEKRLAELGYI